jgi:hypothetical protein
MESKKNQSIQMKEGKRIINKQNEIMQKEDQILKKQNTVIKKLDKVKSNKKQQNLLHPGLKSLYGYSLAHPEKAAISRIPRLSGEVCLLHRHASNSFTVGASASAIAFVWQPFFLQENGVLLTTLGVGNGLFYNGLTGTTSYTGSTINYNMPSNTITKYRLVSASMRVIPQLSMLNAVGKVSGGIIAATTVTPANGGTPFPITAGSTTDPNTQIISNVENFSKYGECSLQNGQTLSLNYAPTDMADLDLYQIDTNGLTYGASSTECTFYYILSGLPANTVVIAELYLNFEVVPAIGSVLIGMETPQKHFDDPMLTASIFENTKQQLTIVQNQKSTSAFNYAIEPQSKVLIDVARDEFSENSELNRLANIEANKRGYANANSFRKAIVSRIREEGL